MPNKPENTWCVIPAAGSGQRMNSHVPKPYLELAGEPLLAHSIRVFLEVEEITGIVVGLAPRDRLWRQFGLNDLSGVHSYEGGNVRAETVRRGLDFLQSELNADPMDWVMVHDAARPLVGHDDVQRLLRACRARDCGGILATVSVDTIKRSDGNGMILATEERDVLWRALTPQCFRLGLLGSAIREGLDQLIVMTDESAAMERSGHNVQLVPGSSKNLKVTIPSDLELARVLLTL